MKTLYSYINESLQRAFHFTTLDCTMEICKTDTFTCSHDDGKNETGFYYMSLSRQGNTVSGYPQGMINDNIVRFVIDYDKLRSKYKIKSLDFCRGKGIVIKANWPDKEAFDDAYDELKKQPNVECEDRVYLKDDSIKNFHQYVIELQVNMGKISSYQLSLLKKYCKDNNFKLTLQSSKTFKYNR